MSLHVFTWNCMIFSLDRQRYMWLLSLNWKAHLWSWDTGSSTSRHACCLFTLRITYKERKLHPVTDRFIFFFFFFYIWHPFNREQQWASTFSHSCFGKFQLKKKLNRNWNLMLMDCTEAINHKRSWYVYY